MRYRKLTASGDYNFGHGNGPGTFFINEPAAVGQAILTRLKLFQGELFFATQDGVPYATQVFGLSNKENRDQLVMNTILNTQGVTLLNSFTSNLDPVKRIYSFQALVTTQYSTTPIPVSM